MQLLNNFYLNNQQTRLLSPSSVNDLLDLLTCLEMTKMTPSYRQNLVTKLQECLRRCETMSKQLEQTSNDKERDLNDRMSTLKSLSTKLKTVINSLRKLDISGQCSTGVSKFVGIPLTILDYHLNEESGFLCGLRF